MTRRAFAAAYHRVRLWIRRHGAWPAGFDGGVAREGAMSADAGYEVSPEVVATLAQTIAESWALCNRLLSVGLVIGCGMFVGRAAARAAVAGGFDLALSSAARSVCLLSHAKRVHDLVTAVEDAVLATSDPPTREDLSVVYRRAACLCRACHDASVEIEGEDE